MSWRCFFPLPLLLAGCVMAPSPGPSPSPPVVAIFHQDPSYRPPSVAPSAAATPQLTPELRFGGAFLFYEDFEKGVDRWKLPDPAAPVNWRLLQAYTCGGAYTMLMGYAGARPGLAPSPLPTGEPQSGESTFEFKEPITLVGAKRPFLKFDVLGQVEPMDRIRVQTEIRLLPDGEWKPAGDEVKGRYPLVATRYVELSPFINKQIGLRFVARFQAIKPAEAFLLDDIQVLEAL